eukprot:2003369-Rhodomonas_salina.1
MELTRPILERLDFEPRKSGEEPKDGTPRAVTDSADGKQPKKKAQLNPVRRRRLREAAESGQQAPGEASADADAVEQDKPVLDLPSDGPGATDPVPDKAQEEVGLELASDTEDEAAGK